MSDAEYTIKKLRDAAEHWFMWAIPHEDARVLVKHVDHLTAENERLTVLATRHESAFRHICDLLGHKVGSDPIHAAAIQAVNDFVMLGVQEAVARERAAVVEYLRFCANSSEGHLHEYIDDVERGEHTNTPNTQEPS